MAAGKKGTCKDCGMHVGKENISRKNLCYNCAKKRMVEFFDEFWRANHPRRTT